LKIENDLSTYTEVTGQYLNSARSSGSIPSGKQLASPLRTLVFQRGVFLEHFLHLLLQYLALGPRQISQPFLGN